MSTVLGLSYFTILLFSGKDLWYAVWSSLSTLSVWEQATPLHFREPPWEDNSDVPVHHCLVFFLYFKLHIVCPWLSPCTDNNPNYQCRPFALKAETLGIIYCSFPHYLLLASDVVRFMALIFNFIIHINYTKLHQLKMSPF